MGKVRQEQRIKSNQKKRVDIPEGMIGLYPQIDMGVKYHERCQGDSPAYTWGSHDERDDIFMAMTGHRDARPIRDEIFVAPKPLGPSGKIP